MSWTWSGGQGTRYRLDMRFACARGWCAKRNHIWLKYIGFAHSRCLPVVLIIWVPVYKQGEEQFCLNRLLNIAASVIPASPPDIDAIQFMHIIGNPAACQRETRVHISICSFDRCYIYLLTWAIYRLMQQHWWWPRLSWAILHPAGQHCSWKYAEVTQPLPQVMPLCPDVQLRFIADQCNHRRYYVSPMEHTLHQKSFPESKPWQALHWIEKIFGLKNCASHCKWT